MPSQIVTGTSGAVTMPGTGDPLPGRIVVTLLTGTTPVGVTTDGSTPAALTSTTLNKTNQQWIPAAIGSYVVFTPVYPSGQPALSTTVNLISSASVTCSVQW